MNASLARRIDRWAIEMAARAMPRQPQAPDSSVEAGLMLERLDFLRIRREPPPDLRMDEAGRFSYASAVSTPWAENNRVQGRFFPVKGDWRARPTVILLHGWKAEFCYHLVFPWLARRLNRAGFNAAAIELPYHASRIPTARGAIRNFISEDLARMVEATAQALGDVQLLLNHFQGQGGPGCGLWGFSLGAWLAGLCGCIRHDLRFLAMTTPVARLEKTIQHLSFCEPIRQALRRTPLNLAPLDLTSHRPLLPGKKVLLVGALHDEFIPRADVEQLATEWGNSKVEWLEQGHISALFSSASMASAVAWMEAP